MDKSRRTEWKSNRISQLALLAALLLLPSVVLAQSRQVVLQTTMGDIRIALSDSTPLHRDNFLKLVGEHFYDSLLFHRVIRHFMIQAGAPHSRHAQPGMTLGDDSTDYTLPAEIRTPLLFHRRGMVAAAREGDDVNPERRSSGRQFYIVWGTTYSSRAIDDIAQKVREATDGRCTMTEAMRTAYRKTGGAPHLDGQYTVFGEVVEGMDVVDRIQRVFTDDYDRPVDDVRILRAYQCR